MGYFDLEDENIKFGELENFNEIVNTMNYIKGLQLLLENIQNGFYPENYKEAYKTSLNNIIKASTKKLEEEMERLHNFYKLSENYKEDDA